MPKVKCPSCKYMWETKSKMFYITCPNCQRKLKKKSNEVKSK